MSSICWQLLIISRQNFAINIAFLVNLLNKSVSHPDTLYHLNGVYGSSGERETFRVDLENRYAASLESDARKDAELQRERELVELEAAQRSSTVAAMMERRIELGDEVSEDENHIPVKVRHPTVGNVSRRFAMTDTFANVHQWVGSLAPDPVNFSLCDYAYGVVSLAEPVYRGTFSIAEIKDAEPETISRRSRRETRPVNYAEDDEEEGKFLDFFYL